MNKYLDYVRRNTIKLNEARKQKIMVFIISTMRSGSTLLKSLLANAPDISHLPEVDFQKYTNKNAWKIKTLSQAKIIVLKKPASYDQSDYPKIPEVSGSKKILLIRDVYDTVLSLKSMNQSVYPEYDKIWSYEKLVHDYWCKTIKNILEKTSPDDRNTLILKYEDLIAQPLEKTLEIFQWLGSRQAKGVDSYSPSKNHKWQWGKDDGGEKIKSLKIQKPSPKEAKPELLKIIEQSKEVNDLRKRLGYI